jgi:hypothetical protein
MKRLSVLALVSAVSLGLAGNVTQTISYSPASLQLGTDKGYTTVDMSGFPHVEKLGAPSLPVMAYQVVIPPTAEVTGFEIADLREEPVSGIYYVMPVQYPQAWMENSKQFPFVEPNPAYYSDNAAYPSPAAQFVDVGTKSGYRLASFLVYPVRYNPVTRVLSVVTKLTIKINYAEHKIPVARRSEMQNLVNGSAVARLVLNPEDALRFAPPKKTASFGSAFLPAGTYEHVILAASIYKDSLIRLRDWRTRQGWRSIIVPIESVCVVYPGVDTAEKMRNFLKDAETTWSTIFCFIARQDWPAHQYRNAYGNVPGYLDYFPSDWYFGCLDGSWNADGDGYWGEPTDSVDCWSDIHVGMITLDGFTELSNYLAKVFRYEFTPDTGWFTKALLGNDVTFSNEYNDSIANATPSPPWFDLKMYASGGMVTPTVQRYCDSLNHGYPITAVIAHGNVDVYGMGGDITSPIMNALTNTNRLSMFTGVCCHTGAWDEVGNTNGDCIAENMAFHAPNGFIGVDMNTRYGWVAVAEFFNYSISYGLLGTRSARTITQGEALSYGKDYWHALVAVTTDTSKFRWEAYERTLFGEPAVPIWMGKAFNVSVTKPTAINIGSGVPVSITVNSQDGPVDSAMVCLIKGTETFARGFTAANGQLTLYVTPLTPGWLQLTVSGANNIPYLDSIQVVSSGKFVCYLRHFISDSTPGGNGDSIINPGESFRIPMWVKNYGTQAASSVTGRLIAHTAGVTIGDSIKSFGTVNGADSAYNSQGFGMSVNAGLPNNYAIACSLVCKDSDDSTWVSYVTFRVGAPVIMFVDKVVKDSAGSQPNGKLDPGETADLEITLGNTGIGNATNVQAVLRSGDSRLAVPDTLAVYGTILHESTAVNRSDHFTLHADAGIPPETQVTCTLKVTGDGGYAVALSFTLIVGECRKVDPIPDGPRTPALYWSFDDADSGYVQHPTYEWVEVKGLGTQLSFPQNDDVIVIDIPTGFGPVRYYNQDYTQLSVSADGWIACGNSAPSNFENTGLPDSSAPPGVICANWDDLYPETEGLGYVYYYHDAASHRFVVEYDSVAYYSQMSVRDKFEFVFYDTTLAAEDGNSRFLFQYMTASQTSAATIGMQDQTMAVGIQCLYNNAYHKGATTWTPQHAILFTTDEPLMAVSEPAGGVNLTRKPLEIFPSPFNSATRINWQMKQAGTAELKVYDAGGRVVRTLASGPCPAGSYTTVWNGADDAGRKLALGVYFVRLATPDQTVKVKTVLAR